MTYVDRRDKAAEAAQDRIANAEELLTAERYGLAASALRAAADHLDRAAAEQHCIDLASTSMHWKRLGRVDPQVRSA